MHLNTLYFAALLSTLAAGLPLQDSAKSPNVVKRAKSYAIVNVDGGSSTLPPAPSTTTTEEHTQTTQVTDAAPTVTPTASTSSTRSSATSSRTSTSLPPSTSSNPTSTTAAPSVVTIIITESSEPTQYYDNGMWHTSYAIKTFEAVSTASAALPASAPPVEGFVHPAYNQTEASGYRRA